MGTLRIILLLRRVAGIVFGMLAVYYWFRASTVTITDADKRYDPKLDFVLNDQDHKADDVNFFATQRSRAGSTGLLRAIRRFPFLAKRQYHSSS